MGPIGFDLSILELEYQEWINITGLPVIVLSETSLQTSLENAFC